MNTEKLRVGVIGVGSLGQWHARIYSELEDTELVVRVHDSGPGIDPAQLETIFDPFSTTRSEGLGMGLAIARRLMELHHGRIEAANSPGGGALFTLRFPAPAGDESEPEKTP